MPLPTLDELARQMADPDCNVGTSLILNEVYHYIEVRDNVIDAFWRGDLQEDQMQHRVFECESKLRELGFDVD